MRLFGRYKKNHKKIPQDKVIEAPKLSELENYDFNNSSFDFYEGAVY